VNRTCNEKMRARKERKQTRSATRLAAKERGRGGVIPPLNLNAQMRRKRRGELLCFPCSTAHNPSPFLRYR
jgi:hypothetical protein